MDEKNNGVLTNAALINENRQLQSQNLVASAAAEYNLSEMIKIGKFLANLLSSKVPVTQKLCSKKLWLAVAGVLFGFIGQFTSADATSSLLNVGLEIISVMMYIFSEASVDKARAVQNTATVELLDTMTGAVAQLPQKQESSEDDQPPVG